MEIDFKYILFFFSSIFIIWILSRNLNEIEYIEILGTDVTVNIEVLNATLGDLTQLD
jgi:hypothetical protein